MFVTNLTSKKLGINGRVNLAAHEVNRFIDNEDTDLVARVLRLEAARLVSVVRETGLTKTGISGKVVKTVGFDSTAVDNAPRTKGVEVKPEPAKDAPKEKVAEAKATETKSTAKSKTTKRNSTATQVKAKAEAKAEEEAEVKEEASGAEVTE